MVKINKTTEILGIIDPDVLCDKGLSLTAKGIYATIMNSIGGKLELNELYECSTDNKDEVDNAVKELLERDLILTVQ